jgi:hypothetical protein
VGPAPGSEGTITCTSASLPVDQMMVVTVNVTEATVGTFQVTGRARFNGADTNAGVQSVSRDDPG